MGLVAELQLEVQMFRRMYLHDSGTQKNANLHPRPKPNLRAVRMRAFFFVCDGGPWYGLSTLGRAPAYGAGCTKRYLCLEPLDTQLHLIVQQMAGQLTVCCHLSVIVVLFLNNNLFG
jgi:hypothetical protein